MLSLVSRRKAAEKAFRIFCTPQRKANKKLPQIFEDAEKLSFRINNQRIAGYRWNQHTQSKKVLIIHGFESSARNFDAYVQPLIDMGYEVLAFDAPAHGESEGRQINVLEYKDMLEDIYERFGPMHAFLAHSFGGLAISLALENIPHKREVKLVLIAPATETSSAVELLFKTLQLNGRIRKEFDDLIVELGKRPITWYSISRALANIEGQVLWIHDEEDTITPFDDVKPVMQKNAANVEFYITRGLGHRRIYKDESVQRKIQQFLQF
jgi:pimeloyl-ACP methyl ester carboxylesterase